MLVVHKALWLRFAKLQRVQHFVLNKVFDLKDEFAVKDKNGVMNVMGETR